MSDDEEEKGDDYDDKYLMWLKSETRMQSYYI